MVIKGVAISLLFLTGCAAFDQALTDSMNQRYQQQQQTYYPLTIAPNTYGPGVNSDQYGRPQTYYRRWPAVRLSFRAVSSRTLTGQELAWISLVGQFIATAMSSQSPTSRIHAYEMESYHQGFNSTMTKARSYAIGWRSL